MELAPTTLLEAIKYFSDPDRCLQFMAEFRWPNGPVCPTCGSVEVRFLASRKVWECKSKHERKQFSIKVGTIFEGSNIGLDKWLPAIWMLVNDKNGISSYELARALGVTQKTGWFMLSRIRLAMQQGSFEKLDGEVEVDETFIGGKARNMHVDRRRTKIKGTGGMGKAIVMGLLERHGKVQVAVVPDRTRATLQPAVRAVVKGGAELMTDALASYRGLEAEYVHKFVDHAEKYVDGNVHTNNIEKLLESVEAHARRHLRKRGAVPPIPVSRRAGIPLQRARRHRQQPVCASASLYARQAIDVQEAHRTLGLGCGQGRGKRTGIVDEEPTAE